MRATKSPIFEGAEEPAEGLTCRDHATRCRHGNCILATVTVIFADNPSERFTAIGCHKRGCGRRGPAAEDMDGAVRSWNDGMGSPP